ncbi:hypothetical protein [Rhizobium lusitanum]|uniref:DUF7946 domain-containing protein n=1 Tax=Rhizobium lusitanum TaxID=293958 RepID=UPI00195B8F1D|nr:hypothetical protein [Rhizobium lusitanum]MBM7045219.1 hypothetical protein [Rhizobium lusitanum]
MNIEKIDPIRISFKGLDADNHMVELGALAASLQGAAKIIGAGGQVALTGRYAKRDVTGSVRVLGLPPQPGSYEFWVMVTSYGAASLTPVLPIIETAVRTAATKATEAIVNNTIARWAGRSKDVDQSNAVAIKALEEMGHTTRAAMEMVERVALSNHTAAKMVVNPIGLSAATVQIGHISSGAFPVTEVDRQTIERAEPIEIGEERTMQVHITELDLVTKSCKVSVAESDKPGKRIPGQITDPQVALPGNPYSTAFDSQLKISVRCKPQYSDGELDRLFISDIAREQPSAS